eukprot:225607-Amphidinium_carterae.1
MLLGGATYACVKSVSPMFQWFGPLWEPPLAFRNLKASKDTRTYPSGTSWSHISRCTVSNQIHIRCACSQQGCGFACGWGPGTLIAILSNTLIELKEYNQDHIPTVMNEAPYRTKRYG